MKISRFFSKKDISFNLEKFPNESNILLITGLSGSGKSYLANIKKEEYNATPFQVEWLIHNKHVTEECKYILTSFLDKHEEIKELAANKWNNHPNEDDNELLKKYINLFLLHFLELKDPNKLYIIEGLQLFALIDFNLIKNYPIIIKRTSSFKSLKNRFKRDYKRKFKKEDSLKSKREFFHKVIKQSKTYQFKHRKTLNKFILKYKKGTTM